MNPSALAIENLIKDYRPQSRWGSGAAAPVRALDGMSFEVARGSIFGLLGPNGAGKTTLLRILSTLLQPTSGRAFIEGFDVVRQPLEVRRRICVVLQETAVELLLSVRENLLTYARFQGIPSEEARRRTEELLQRFEIASEADRKGQDLSGGIRRRVQVAKVFLGRSPVVYLDEFSTGMDAILKRSVMNWLREEAASGRTIVLTTHILSEAEELCDDILIMNKGRQVARGDLRSLKLLSEGVYDIAMTFDQLPVTIEEEVRRLSPVRMSINQSTLEVTLRPKDSNMLAIVNELGRGRNVRHLEVKGASLEDIFVELTRKG